MSKSLESREWSEGSYTVTVLIELLVEVLLLYLPIPQSFFPSLNTTAFHVGQPHLQYPPIQDTACPIRAAGPEYLRTYQGEANRRTGSSDYYYFTLQFIYPSSIIRRKYQIDPSTGHRRPAFACNSAAFQVPSFPQEHPCMHTTQDFHACPRFRRLPCSPKRV